MSIRFGRYRVTFKNGEQPHYLVVAWPTGTHANDVAFERATAQKASGLLDGGFFWIESERREMNGITIELELHGKLEAFIAEEVGPRISHMSHA